MMYWKESANFYIIERENEKIFTDSDSKEKKISNIKRKDNENPNTSFQGENGGFFATYFHPNHCEINVKARPWDYDIILS